ncbi:MAG: acyltransferase [Sphingomonas bacterium]
MGGERQIGLDAVRGIAILLVLLFHFNQPVGVGAFDMLLGPFRTTGWIGVELFFVLSGFLVGGIVLAENATNAGFDWRRFLLRRAFRLWPILYLYVAALALGGVAWSGVWPVLLHIQNYSDNARSHLWSLAVEEHFYLLAAIGLPWLARIASPRQIFGTLAGLIVAVNVLRLGAVAGNVSWYHVHNFTQFRLDALTAGVLLAAVKLHRPDLFASLQRRRILLLLMAISGCVIIAFNFDVLRNGSIDLTLAWLAAVPLVIAASDLEVRGALVRPTRLMAALGLIAYPLYIWHILIGNIASIALQGFGVVDPLTIAIGRFACAIGLALLLHRMVELPCMALRERIGPLSRAQRKSVRPLQECA